MSTGPPPPTQTPPSPTPPKPAAVPPPTAMAVALAQCRRCCNADTPLENAIYGLSLAVVVAVIVFAVLLT
ncbi:hypothetical protein AAC387_Pa04g0467 [Persea americana]